VTPDDRLANMTPEEQGNHLPPEASIRSEKIEASESGSAEPPPHPDTDEDTGVGSGRGAATGRRRWVSTLVGILVIAIVAALLGLMIFLHLNGTLGPGTH
jgi:hypothetical protein